jgi:repressor LexA
MKETYKAKIFSFYKSNRRMPNISEIMHLFKFASRSSAAHVVKALVQEGVVEKDSKGKLVPTPKMHELKLLGNIRAGFAAPAEEELADTISIGEYLINHKESSYLLQVEGDSMIDAGIHDGDMVIFERRLDAKVGDIVVALTEDGYTLKYLRKKNGKIYLEAANSAYPDIHPREGQIIGVVRSTFRTYA